jgi:hypothetical protein
VPECDREVSANRRSWATRGCCAVEKKCVILQARSCQKLNCAVVHIVHQRGIIIIIIIIIIIYLTANGLSPVGSGYYACTYI